MPRRPPLALLALLLAASCSHSGGRATGPVTVHPAGPLDAATQQACASLVAQLPVALGDAAARRLTAPDRLTTAAWGDPAITLVCGGPAGSAADEPFTVDGIRWAIHDIGAARTWTTLDHVPPVQVTMPDAYENQAELLGSLSGPLSSDG